MRAFAAFIILLWSFSDAFAQQVIDSPEADRTALTIYPDDLAMVTEVRKISIPAGQSTLRFLGVSDQIIAQTAVLQSFEGFTLESNFDGDLITRGALLNKSVGSEITVKRLNEETGEITLQTGKIVSAPIQDVVNWRGETTEIEVLGIVLETQDGVEALECAGLAEAIIFSKLPNGLNPKPVLSMNVRSDTAQEAEITLSYLTQGISWEADYRLDVGPSQSGEGPLSGWLTVTNSTAKSFKDVPTSIIAGRLNRQDETKNSSTPQKEFQPSCWTVGSTKWGTRVWPELYQHYYNGYTYGGAVQPAPAMMMRTDADYGDDEIIVTATKRQATVEDFADYKLYRVPKPVTVAALQTKQIAFLDVANAEYERIFKTELYWRDIDVKKKQQPYNSGLYFEIDNSREGNLAKPLPKGNVWIMTERANGQTAYLGEAGVRDMAVDLPVELWMSRSPYVQILPTLKLGAHEGLSGVMVGVDVFNSNPEEITFEFTLDSTNVGLADIQGSSHPHKSDEARPVYKFPVPAENKTPFYLFFEYLSSQHFSYFDVGYIDGTPGDTDVINSTPGLTLKNGGNVEWLAELVDKLEDSDGELEMTATLLEIEEFEDEDDDFERIRETFKFSNKTGVDQIVTFDFYDEVIELEKSSLEPNDPTIPAWKFEIKAGESVTLDVTYRLY